MNYSILIADDDESIRFVLTKALKKEGYRIFCARNGSETVDLLRTIPIDVILLDIFMPDTNGLDLIETIQEINSTVSIIIVTAHGTTQIAIEAAKRRTYDYITKPFDIIAVTDLVARAAYAANQAKQTLADLKSNQERTLNTDTAAASSSEEDGRFQIVGDSPAMHVVFQIIGRAAMLDETMLIMGESGTGKELVARAIHQNSRRAEASFVVVDCSAVPPGLIESTLFGHVRGAFTGADADRQGKFKQAHGGTIFLDEVGELPTEVQMKLLRVLQEREVEPVGSNVSSHVDVRVIAATNRQLDLAIQKGAFREDLFYRLNVVPIYLPPLRERKQDIRDLVDSFIRRFAGEYNLPEASISPEAFEILVNYDWPGNVRELENTLKRALVMCSGHVLLPEHFPQLVTVKASSDANADTSYGAQLNAMIKERVDEYIESDRTDGLLYTEIRAGFEKALFRIVLERTGWNRSKAAELLGINRNTLHSKMEEYAIKGA
ncbi:MAG: sigma-54 dependent transcriptional regulator [Candidatus Poribacteria bacterium]|nr:sigma-54 dependent transcriptional regulator [Candidatus Poribacteria bacterium]